MKLRDPRFGDAEHLADLAEGQLLVVVEGDHELLALGEAGDRVAEDLAELGLVERVGRAPTDEEIAQKVGVTVDELEESLTDIARSSIAALDELWTVSDGGDQVSLIDTVEDQDAPDPQGSLSQTEQREAIADAIARLPEREKLVVTLYYYEELTLREIGEVLGVTESRVSQLHTKAILRLKARLSGSPARAGLES